MTTTAVQCGNPWCHKTINPSVNRYGGHLGRPPKYCDERCRQAAYRHRKNRPCPNTLQVVVPGAGQLNIDPRASDPTPGVVTVHCEGKINHPGPCSGRPWINWLS